jgi:hypothetical protein
MKKRIGILCLFLSSYSFGITVDYAVEFKSGLSIADMTIEIVDGLHIADETWEIVGACSNRPTFSIEIVDGLSIADKKICITNPKSLDKKILKKLKLIKE